MDQHPASSPLEPFSATKRLDNLNRMEQESFDLLIIGGGLTGAGIASEAARWGYKVALVEKGDFASGASSKTSKLVHGSLRYLSTLHFGLIFEACHQRHQLLRPPARAVYALLHRNVGAFQLLRLTPAADPVHDRGAQRGGRSHVPRAGGHR